MASFQGSVGCQIILSIAYKESRAGQFPRIETGHLFCGLLKYVELSDRDMARIIGPDKDSAPANKEKQSVITRLFEIGLKPPAVTTKCRHLVRTALGKHEGAIGAAEGVIQLSPSANQALRDATHEARAHGGGNPTAVHLAQSILATKDPLVLKIALDICDIANVEEFIPSRSEPLRAAPRPADVGDARRSPPRQPPAWVEKWGKDVTYDVGLELPADFDPSPIMQDAVCVTVARALFDRSANKKKPAQPLLLVGAGDRRPRDVITDVSRWIVSSRAPDYARNVRIYEINSAAVLDRANGDPVKRLDQIFEQTAVEKKSALFFDKLHRFLNPKLAGDDVAAHIRDCCSRSEVPCVLAMDQEQYEKTVKPYPEWESVFRIIWVHSVKAQFKL
jgi:hypothetical protein